MYHVRIYMYMYIHVWVNALHQNAASIICQMSPHRQLKYECTGSFHVRVCQEVAECHSLLMIVALLAKVVAVTGNDYGAKIFV